MAFVQFSKVSLAFGGRDILKDVSVNLAAGTKAALTGANGAGKSTLIKVMAGLAEPDSGERVAQRDCRIAYLPQSGLVHRGCSLREEADKAFGWGYDVQRQADALGEQMASAEGGAAGRLAEQQAALLARLEESGWYRRAALAEQVLLGLGFSREDFSRQTDEFSGGWQMRIALAKALMCGPDILLLDEPTNYLDIEARDWLERFLADFAGGFLLVSHDRYFLDHTISEVYELFGGTLRRYPGNFTHYEEVRRAELASLMAEYDQQQQEIRRLEDFIRRFGAKATKAAQAQERQKMLDRLLASKIEIPESLKKIRFSFPPAPHSGRLVLTLDGVCRRYAPDGPDVIHGLSLVLEKGERLVVAGRNGAGKSTLLRIVAGADADYSGAVKLGAGVSVGYFSQDSAEKISGGESILDFLEARCPLELVPKARDLLGAFLFRGDDVFKSIGVLSGGEKSRIALLELLLRPVNLLVLDEPTNHLDMHSKDVLLDALKDFGGTVIFVSHDRGFIEELSTRVLELRCGPGREGSYRVFPGDYRYYMRRLEDEAAGTVGASSFGAGGAGAGLPGGVRPAGGNGGGADARRGGDAVAPPAGRQSWEEQKKAQAERRKLEREVERLEASIAAAEARKAALEASMADPEVYSDGEKARGVQRQIDDAAAELDALNAAWEAAAERLG